MDLLSDCTRGCDKTFVAEEQGDVTLVHLLEAGVADRKQVPLLREELLNLTADQERKKFLIDFSGVKEFTSEVIGAMVLIWKRVSPRGGVVRLVGVDDHLREVFRITKLDGHVFKIYGTVAAAMEGF